MKLCIMCGGGMEPREITVTRAYGQGTSACYAIITDVPAEVCNQCGETTYSPDVVDRLQAVSKQVRKGAPPPKTVAVPVYSLREAVE